MTMRSNFCFALGMNFSCDNILRLAGNQNIYE